jgi:hypothetical protein
MQKGEIDILFDKINNFFKMDVRKIIKGKKIVIKYKIKEETEYYKKRKKEEDEFYKKEDYDFYKENEKFKFNLYNFL